MHIHRCSIIYTSNTPTFLIESKESWLKILEWRALIPVSCLSAEWPQTMQIRHSGSLQNLMKAKRTTGTHQLVQFHGLYPIRLDPRQSAHSWRWKYACLKIQNASMWSTCQRAGMCHQQYLTINRQYGGGSSSLTKAQKIIRILSWAKCSHMFAHMNIMVLFAEHFWKFQKCGTNIGQHRISSTISYLYILIPKLQ